jgi:hypothetical protein
MNSEVLKEIFWLCLGIMKNILSLAEFKLGKNTDDYKYFKKEVMDYFYNGLNKFYENLVKKSILKKCVCGAKLRHGYSPCKDCGGSGYTVKN